MPRQPRHFVPGVPQHLVQRGNNRQPCFFAERDYLIYLDKLNEYRQKFNVEIHSFVLMTNHVHLLLTPTDAEGVSCMLQALGRYFVRYINSSYARTGTLWEGRFKTSLIDTEEYFLTVSRYIEMNTVRAGMVPYPASYPWSSYRKNALGKDIALLTPHPLYLALGATDEMRQSAYRGLFASHISDTALDEIRTAANKTWVLGNNKFKQSIEERLGYAIPPFPKGGDKRSKEAVLQSARSWSIL